MTDLLIALYPWTKALHIISVIFWMAGMLMLPRLFVYHWPSAAGSELSEKMKAAEKRLLRIIVNPAMVASWIFGLCLFFTIFPGFEGLGQAGWMHAKLLLVILMSGFHGFLSGQRRKFENDERPKSERFYRMINEIPAVLVIFIVILVVVKPF